MDHATFNPTVTNTTIPWAAIIGQIASNPGLIAQLSQAAPLSPSPVAQLSVTAAQVLNVLAERLAGALVVQTHLWIYNSIARAEQQRAPMKGGSVNMEVSDHYWNFCVAKSVREMCRKPCDCDP